MYARNMPVQHVVQAFSNPAPIDDGLDRQNLATLRKRFLSINEDRLTRLRSGLNDRQLLFLEVLPLLFHSNHMMMPGYVSRQTPCKISGYKPNDKQLGYAKTIAKSFTLQFEPGAPESIYGIYVMGSVGTIAQSSSSDLDIWLCFRPDLGEPAKQALALKCKKIQEWASTLKLEVHFFLMNPEEFKRGYTPELKGESSGSAQKFLLLDEFYRSAIYIAGRMPLWWFVPPQEEEDYEAYTDVLLKKKFLHEHAVLDFGDVATVPPGEFIGAAIWQLYKAIDSPYKSTLKLLLLEAYVGNDNVVEPLSLEYKRRVFRGETSIEELDSYVMIYRRIEKYLREKQEADRLELARRCFYFKVNQKLSRNSTSLTKSWQRTAMEKFVDEWNWTFEHVSVLDNREEWKTNKVTFERNLLVNELNHCYNFLLNYNKTIGKGRSISSDELTVLGRRLQAVFERRPGKIEWINPGISQNIAENTIFLSDFYDKYSKTRVWAAFTPDPIQAGKRTPIKSASSLMEILLWTYVNQISDSSTHFDLQEVPTLNQPEIKKILASLQDWLPLPLKELPHASFHKSAQPQDVLLLLNVGKSPTPDLDERGMQRLSNYVDAMGYSGFKENLIVSVDMVTRNSWNEIQTRRFEGQNALLRTLEEYLQLCLPGTHQAPPKLRIECIGSTHSATIQRRVSGWLNAIVECYYRGRYPPQTRYIFAMGGEWFCLQFIGLRLRVQQFAKEHQLLRFLAEDQAKPSPIVIDVEARPLYPLQLIAKFHKKESISVFYRRFDIGMELFVLDERCSLSHFVLRGRNDYNPLVPLHRFLRAVILRQTRLYHEFTSDFGIFPVNFVELEKDNQNHFFASSKRIAAEVDPGGKLDVKAVAHLDDQKNLQFDFYCDNQEFAAVAFGDQLDIVVAQYILKHRKTGEHYPVYISDLDLSLVVDQVSTHGSLQIGHYLKIKNMLEVRLNQAIGILIRA